MLPKSNLRKDVYIDLQTRIGMTKSPKTDKTKHFLYAIYNYLINYEDPTTLWNNALLHKTKLWGADAVDQWEFIRGGGLYYFTIDVIPDPDLKTGLEKSDLVARTSGTSLKRARSDFQASELDGLARLEDVESINILLARSRLYEDRLAALEINTSGSLHKDAEPNTSIIRPNKTIEERLAALEMGDTRFNINDATPDKFDQLVTAVADRLPSQLQFQKQADASWSRALNRDSFRQEIIYYLTKPLSDVAEAVAKDSMKAYVETEEFTAIITEIIKKAVTHMDLTDIEKTRAKTLLYDYIKTKWHSYRENLRKMQLQDIKEAVAKIQAELRPLPVSNPNPVTSNPQPYAPPPRSPSPHPTRYDSSDDEPSNPKDIEAKIRKEVIAEQRLAKKAENEGRNLAKRVANYLQAQTGITHFPIGLRVKKTEASGRVTIISQVDVKKYEKAAEAWEEAQTQAILAPPAPQPVAYAQQAPPQPQLLFAPTSQYQPQVQQMPAQMRQIPIQQQQMQPQQQQLQPQQQLVPVQMVPVQQTQQPQYYTTYQ